MLRVSESQEAVIQDQLDEPMVADYCQQLEPDTAPLGIAGEELRSRVAAGVRAGRKLDARDGFEMNACVAMAVFAGAGLWGMFAMARSAGRRSLVAPVMLYLTQALWFVAPTAVSWASGMAAPQTRYSTGVLALMHSAQYLWITQYFAKREQGAGWRPGRYWFAVIAGKSQPTEGPAKCFGFV